MTKKEKTYLQISLSLAAASGLLIFVVDTFFSSEGLFGRESNPILSEIKFVHYLSAPLLIISMGMIISAHILPGLKGKKTKRKTSGKAMTLCFFALILTGQSLLYVTGEDLKEYLE